MKADVCKADAVLKRRKHLRGCLFADIRPQVQEFKDAGRGSHALLNGGVDAGHALDRLVEHDERGQKGHEGAGRGMTIQHLRAAEPDDQGYADAAHEFHHRMGQTAVFGLHHKDIHDTLRLVGKALFFVGLGTEGLDDADACDGFMQPVGGLAKLGLVVGAQPAEFRLKSTMGTPAAGRKRSEIVARRQSM